MKTTQDSPAQDIIDYANRYGFATLGYAVCQMCVDKTFIPDWNFAKEVWSYGGNDSNTL